MNRFWAWARRDSDQLNATAAWAGVAVAVLGFSLTIYQLRATANALRASNTYSIQSDARSLNETTSDSIQKIITETVSDTDRTKVEHDAWRVFNFYLAVYRQVQAGGVSSEFSESFRTDFCQFLSIPQISGLWDRLLHNKKLGRSNISMREAWCGVAQQP